MTATLTATSADVGYRDPGAWSVGGGPEGVAEGADGLALESKSDVGIDVGGDADVSAAEEFLDYDEVDALFQEQGGGRAAGRSRW
ncbi:hypothetical protein [Streptomyces sanglieri]|uniref:hypothetical protein n=1 Tax=Streptomyces TaxID=1883 RepID=UPI0035266742